MTELTPTLRRSLRAQAHHLHPVVSIAGNGLTPTVLSEIERNLAAHALIKIRVYGEDRHQRAAWMKEICDQTGATEVQHIGNILVLWREKPAEEKPAKPVARGPARPAAKSRARAVPANSRARPARTSAPRSSRTAARGKGR